MKNRVKKVLQFSSHYLNEREELSAQISNHAAIDKRFNPVRHIAEQTGRSERTIQLSYKKYLGFSAKEMIRFERFQKVMHLLEKMPAGTEPDWFEIIHETGYYDQSHLIHDFNYFLDLSPGLYLKLQAEMCTPGS